MTKTNQCPENENLYLDGFDRFVRDRYSSYESGIGARIEKGEVGFEELEKHVLAGSEPVMSSGRQEMLENLINEFI